MRKYIHIAFASALISTGLHFYLAKRSYQLRAGSAGDSLICSVSEKVNCDAALLSSYGNIFGISLSNLGLAFNLALALLLLGILLKFLSEGIWKNLSVYTATLIALASLILMAISLYEKIYCPVCWAAYILSYIALSAALKAFWRESLKITAMISALKDMRTASVAAMILLGAFFLHITFVTTLGLKNIEEEVKAALIDWEGEQIFYFTAKPLLASGPQTSSMRIVEFADFLCPACKKIQPKMEQFLKNHPQAAFAFYAWPLDSECNKEIPFSNQGLSCELAKLALCAQQQNADSKIHQLIFEKQTEFLRSAADSKKTEALKNAIIKTAQLQKEPLRKCMEDSENRLSLEEHIQEGIKARIRGTPSVFVNGKQLRGRAIIQTLQDLYKKLN